MLIPIAISVIIILGFTAGTAHADNIYVRDDAGVLSENVKDEIRNFNKKMESSDRKAQLLVVTVDSIPDGQNIEDYSMSLAEKYKPGDGSKDTGLVYVVAVNDHKDRLEVGYGLEDIIPDSTASRILRSRTSAYRSGDWNAGVESVINGIAEQIINPQKDGYEYRDGDVDFSGFLTALKIILGIILAVGIIAFVVMIIRGISKSDDVYGDGTDYYTPSIGDEFVMSTAAASASAGSSRRSHDDDDDDDAIIPTSTSNSYSSNDDYSSSSFSSFDSFGGGSFGGGGASGSW